MKAKPCNVQYVTCNMQQITVRLEKIGPPYQSSSSLVGLVWLNPSAQAGGSLLVLGSLSCALMVNLQFIHQFLLGKVGPHLDKVE